MRNSLKGPSNAMLLLVMGVITLPTASCAPAKAPNASAVPDYCSDETAFGDELVRCARTAPTQEASRVCRGAVHASCGYKVPEGASR